MSDITHRMSNSRGVPTSLRVAILSVTLGLVGVTSADPGQEQSGKSFLSLLDRQDWGGIYRMASMAEKRRLGLTQEQFIRLNRVIAQGFPKCLKPKFYETLKVKDGWYSLIFKYEALPVLAPDFSREVLKSASGVDLLFINGRWYPQISLLPFDLLAHRQEPAKQRHERLLTAMQKAGVRSLIRLDPLDPPRTLTMSELHLVIQGKLSPREAFRK